MVRKQLIRKRAEHNECIIGTLEELTLHQENIDQIGNLHNLCKNLRILYLQSNMITKIVNLHKLKHLVYLNLALNNIEKIENLESLESLRKLDLTVNFIHELSSAKTLAKNHNLRELYLMGNPCAQFEKYREYVIAFLPQLESLDGNDITHSDRVKASRSSDMLSNIILQAEVDYKSRQKEQDLTLSSSSVQSQSTTEDTDECSKLKQFWDQKSDHCPEARAEIVRHSFEKKQNEARQVAEPQHQTSSVKVDRIYNMNQLKLQFEWRDEPRYYELVLKVFRYLDTSFISVFVHQYYLKVVIKNKVFQITYSEEVLQNKALVRRSRFSGHLKILLEKARPTVCFRRQETTPLTETSSTYQNIEYNDAANNEKQ